MDGKPKKKQRHFSILVTGSSGCGKTSLINRLIKDTFNKEHVPTQHMSKMKYVAQVNGKRINVQISDTDAERNYEGYSINYYATMDALIIIYDISNQESLENVTDICERRKAVYILVGNKSDMKREINKEDVEIFAEKRQMPHIETSAKLNENVTEMFMSVIKRLIENCGNIDDYYDRNSEYDGDDNVPITSKRNSSCSCVIS
ncbi:ras-related protein Rab-13-like isoform X2 [Mytilus trossulus]|uniref:ras-related protein Rab-13-like isoform X2 n=1 Tax=Mytilus trossulus TaxID=6551 RepID=UPI00300482A3